MLLNALFTQQGREELRVDKVLDLGDQDSAGFLKEGQFSADDSLDSVKV